MLLVIDNYDSFTFNLVQYLGELGVAMRVFRNDEISLDQIRELKPERLLISPGPCSPKEAGLSNAIIKTFGQPSRLWRLSWATSASARVWRQRHPRRPPDAWQDITHPP